MDARFLVLLLVLAGPLAAQDKWKDELRRYEEGMKRPPIGKRAGVIDRFARTKDPRALKLLLQRYAKPKLPKAQERYLIAAAVGRYFRDPRFAPILLPALRRAGKREDSWLWFHAGRTRIEAPEPKTAQPMAARFGGLAPESTPADLARIPAIGDMVREQVDPVLLSEQAAALLVSQRAQIRTEAFRAAAESLLERLHDDAPTLPRTRLVIARHFADLFGVQRVSLRARYWRQLLSFEEIKEQEGPTGVGRPRFFGVEATGDRIVFLIDLSDSMLEPLSATELADAKGVEQGAEAKEGKIDWSKIKTRFDLARLFLARYLRSLPSDKRFMVIAFGDVARPLGATKNLVKSSRGSVNKAIRELAKIKPGSKTKRYPYGQLRGATNIHGAFRLAFRATTGRALKEPAYTHMNGLKSGCDTIFLLSDGKPTKDDFQAPDRHTGRVTVNPETGETADGGAGSALFNGPYVRTRYILEDVRRMNLFRKAEIHTVAMGDADRKLMRGLARDGLGGVREIGLREKGGRIREWWAARPFPAPIPELWGWRCGPEEVLKSGFSRPSVWKSGETWVGWTRVTGGWKHGDVDLGSERGSSAYALATVVPDEPGDATLLLGGREALRVWVNGKMVLDEFEPSKSYERDAHEIAITLKPGPNSILVKVSNRDGRRRFHARLTTPDGNPLFFRTE